MHIMSFENDNDIKTLTIVDFKFFQFKNIYLFPKLLSVCINIQFGLSNTVTLTARTNFIKDFVNNLYI
jgi:hypothetical protein